MKQLDISCEGPLDPALLAPLQQLQDFQITLGEWGTGGASPALLQQLAKQTRLTSLQLHYRITTAQWSGTAKTLLSALTASSNLQQLKVDNRVWHVPHWQHQDLTLREVWPHALSEQLRMPGLRSLILVDADNWQAASAAVEVRDSNRAPQPRGLSGVSPAW